MSVRIFPHHGTRENHWSIFSVLFREQLAMNCLHLLFIIIDNASLPIWHSHAPTFTDHLCHPVAHSPSPIKDIHALTYSHNHTIYSPHPPHHRYFLQLLISPTRLPSFITTLSFSLSFYLMYSPLLHSSSPLHPTYHPHPLINTFTSTFITFISQSDYTSKIWTARVSLEAIPQKSKAVLSEIHPKVLLWLVVVSNADFISNQIKAQVIFAQDVL